jgi:hypothetical protein
MGKKHPCYKYRSQKSHDTKTDQLATSQPLRVLRPKQFSKAESFGRTLDPENTVNYIRDSYNNKEDDNYNRK